LNKGHTRRCAAKCRLLWWFR